MPYTLKDCYLCYRPPVKTQNTGGFVIQCPKCKRQVINQNEFKAIQEWNSNDKKVFPDEIMKYQCPDCKVFFDKKIEHRCIGGKLKKT